jgi:iron complex transport system substrate-binding protein
VSAHTIRNAAVTLAVMTVVVPSLARAGLTTASRLVDSSRIVSVGAAVTETLFALGVGERVIATDTTSLWPDAAQRLPRVGYQRSLAAEGILSLGPTVVLVTPEAGPPATLTQLEDAGVTVVRMDAKPSVDGIATMIRDIASVVSVDPRPLLDAVEVDLAAARAAVATRNERPSVLFVLQPPGTGTVLAAGTNTAADAMLALAGARNTAAVLEGYKPLTAEAVVASAPDVIAVLEGTFERVSGRAAFLEAAGLALTPAGRNGRVVEVPSRLLTLGPETGRAAVELARLLDPSRAPEGGRTSTTK